MKRLGIIAAKRLGIIAAAIALTQGCAGVEEGKCVEQSLEHLAPSEQGPVRAGPDLHTIEGSQLVMADEGSVSADVRVVTVTDTRDETRVHLRAELYAGDKLILDFPATDSVPPDDFRCEDKMVEIVAVDLTRSAAIISVDAGCISGEDALESAFTTALVRIDGLSARILWQGKALGASNQVDGSSDLSHFKFKVDGDPSSDLRMCLRSGG